MHSKHKGNIGELYAAAKLSELGFKVFSEMGDLSKIDLIGEKDGKLLSFQVKCSTPAKNGTIKLYLKKSGPNYQFKYDSGQFDYFILVDINSKKIYVVPSSILDTQDTCLTLRFEEAKNGNKKNVNWAEDYLADKILGGVGRVV